MPSQTHSEKIKFPIVGIGASAGGFEAYQTLVQNITETSGMAYVLLQHLPFSHDSILPSLLDKNSDLNVVEITDGVEIKPDSVYVAPGHVLVSIVDGIFKMEALERNNHNPIDFFFKSLAVYGDGFARGVLLSGTGSDGTIGLKAIKECGGATIVQTPTTAAYDGMPLSAIRSGAADFVLDVEEIPAQLLQLDKAYQDNFAYLNDDRNLVRADDDVYKQLIRILRSRTGNDFSHYKQPTIRRRIARRMVIAKVADPEAYLDLVKNDYKEQENLFNDILIPVSYFFRDSKVFDMLSETAFPKIIEHKSENDTIRIWVAGCSTGEEAYSIAICIHEFLMAKNMQIKVQLFASDISENVISKARAGVYSRQEVQNISKTRLQNFFTKIDGSYHIKKEIRDMCIFAVHNFIKDPPFAKMDMIACRNVLIYLDQYLQKKAFTTFHYALQSHGVLFLGKSESASHAPGLFEPLIKNLKIFGRRNTLEASLPLPVERVENVPRNKEKSEKKAINTPDHQKIAEEILFLRYTPAGVIINEAKEIIHFHGNTGEYLLQPPGKPNFNLYKMLREGLAFEVRSAILAAKIENETATRSAIPLKGFDYFVDVEVVPLPESGERHLLILFKKSTITLGERKENIDKKSAEQKRIAQLEAEIEQMREDIRKVTEDQEVANEELQSANEELLSNSEELQTLNEELETSAEELQSNNEELVTVNEELIDRQEQLVFARLYAESIIENIRASLVILDSELRVKSANAAFYSNFNTSENENEGRSIFDTVLGSGTLSTFQKDIEKALASKSKLDNLEITVNNPGLGLRTMILNVRPISNEKLGEALLLLSIEDITEVLEANKLLTSSNAELEENNKQLASFSFVASHDLQEPLRKIQLFSNMVVEGEQKKMSEESLDYLKRVVASADRMQNLIRDLLQYSQLNTSDEDDMELTDLSQLIGDSISELDQRIMQAKAQIEIKKLPNVHIIASLVRQVFTNLILNSIKYGPKNGVPKITVNSELPSKEEISQLTDLPETSFYKISFTDNGIGFPQEKAERLFEPFYRLHSRDKYEGTGIGLAICKKIMTRHEGFITAISSPENGATFSLFFLKNPPKNTN